MFGLVINIIITSLGLGGELAVGKWRLNRLVVTVVIGVMLWGCFTTFVAAHHEVSEDVQKKMNKLDEAAEQMYESAKARSWDKTREHIVQMREWIPQVHYDEVSIEGMNALTESALAAEYSLNRVRINEQEVITAAARLRLAADALTHPHQPMWLEYYKWFEQGAEELGEALKHNNPAKFKEAISQIDQYYEMIKPSVLINRESEIAVKMDSLLGYLRKVASQDTYNREQLTGIITEYKSTVDEMFQRTSQDTYTEFVSNDFPLGGTLAFAAVIIAVLAIAGWRIYRYETKAGFVPVKRKTREY